MDSPVLEREIHALGRRLIDAADSEPPLVLTPEWWQQRMLAWATGDPEFRVKLLRFVDVLPTLRSSGAVADHVKQYFRGDSPPIVQLGTGVGTLAPFRPVLSRAVRQGVFSMAGRFIGGASPAEALPKLRALGREGVAWTVDLLGEATLSEAEADAYLARYSELLQALSAETGAAPADERWSGVPPVNISIKLSALCSKFEPAAPEAVSEATRQRLRPLFRLARRLGAFINVDMEQHRYRDLVQRTFADLLMEAEFRDTTAVGIVVQAYLRDSLEDLERLRALAERRGAPFSIRLVKGAYWDEERIVASQNSWRSPVWDEKPESDASFERCTEALLEAWPHLRPAFGTHNPRSIAQAVAKAKQHGLATREIEFQVLYGMAEGLRSALARDGYRTRVYVPVGEVIPGMAYLVRRLLENTSNVSWFTRKLDAGAAEELLQPPVVFSGDGTPAAAGPRAGFRNEPPARFFEEEQRAAMAAALERARRDSGRTYPLLVGKEHTGKRSLADVRYPAEPSLLLGRVAQATAKDVEEAVAAAAEAFPAWRDRPAAERAALLRRAADLMRDQRFDLAATMVFESGKPWHEADGDVIEAIDYLDYYAGEGERLGRPIPLGDVLGEENSLRYEGRGVAAIIAPWNFPLAIITGMATAALAGGNSAILKPAAQSPIIAARLGGILREAGVPPGVIQYLPGEGGAIGRALVDHPGVAMVAFTGSRQVGLSILAAAAQVRPGQRDLKRVIAEMGGKNAIIIDEDADLDQAVAGTVISAFGYAGQKCSACSRLVVVGSAYEEAMRRLGPAVESLVVGPPHDPSTFVPPVISAGAKTTIEEYIESGRRTARVLVEGAAPGGQGSYVRPTVFVDVPRDAPVACEEIFGPVLSVFRAKDFDEAIEIALDSQYALTGGLFSRNPRHIEVARRSFRVGNLYINRKTTGAIVGRQPFGGLRMSGVGDKAGGPDYVLQFMQPRTITENTTRRGFAPEGTVEKA